MADEKTKKCPFCAEEIDINEMQCNYCGEQLDNAELYLGQVKGALKRSRILPIWKFALLSIITFGIYQLIWFYFNWKFLKEEDNLKISPFWRAWFSMFWAGSFADHLQKHLNKNGIAGAYSPILIGITYFVMSILWKLPDPYWLVSYLSFIPMLPLLNSLNIYWQNKEHNLPPSKFVWWQTIFVIVGILYFVLVIIGTCLPS